MRSLYCLVFVAVLATSINQIHSERSPICYEGSVNYCKDMQTAKACNKLRFCQLVWNPPAGYKVVKNGNHWDVLNPNIGYFHVG